MQITTESYPGSGQSVRRVNEVCLLDMDRFLIDTDKVVDRIYHCFDNRLGNAAVRMVEAEHKRCEEARESFDLWGWARNKSGISNSSLAEVKRDFVRFAPELLFDDAQPLIDRLEEAEQPFFICTYGGEEWSMMKLCSSGLAKYPHTVIDNPGKCEYMLNRRQDGKYVLGRESGFNGTIIANRAVVGDDKINAFKHFDPDTITGYWLNRGGVLLPSQRGQKPDGVIEVASLDDIDVAA